MSASRNVRVLVTVLVLAGAGLLPRTAADTRPAGSTGPTLRADVEFLASERLEGRLTGSPGERRAADYLVERLRALEVGPLPGRDGLVHEFEFVSGTRDTGSSVVIQREGLEDDDRRLRFKGRERVRALSFSESDTVTAPVVFAGYGLTVPDNREVAYDSYVGLDVEGKIVVVLRYVPEEAADEVRQELTRYSGLRYKALQARERGAVAMLVVTGPRSPGAGETIPMSFDAALSGSGMVAASIGGEVVEALFAAVEGKTLEEVQRQLDTANPHVAGFDLPGVTMTVTTSVERERRSGRNVVGRLPAAGDGGASRGAIVLGAHYDHLGRGRHGNSLARKDEAGEVHLGADDNASGVAALLAVTRRLAELPRRHPLIVAFWSGEELGLLGSTRFLKDGLVSPDGIVAYVNMDMVGRMSDRRLNLQGAGSSEAWAGLIERANVPVGLDVAVQDDPYLPTDSFTFYQEGVPTISFFTGSHEDYHRPSDRVERVNFEGLEQIVRFATLFVSKLDALEAPPEWVAVQRTASEMGDRDSVRAYTGTIPDYATEVEGVRLSGVIGGGPADRAGLREGDVIVEFAGREITNIYDYTYALDAVEVDEPVRVVVLRDGRREEITITPTRRP